MLVIDSIAELILGELSEAEAYECLKLLASVPITVELMEHTVAVARSAVTQEAAALSGMAGLLDCCGTGGSGRSHFNVSTTVAFVLAAGGVRVSKFGNRAQSGGCGSFDLLEALGVAFEVPPGSIASIIAETNLAFLYAPDYYPTLKKLAATRNTFGKRTIFNLVGPLLNPTNPEFRLLGVPVLSEHAVIAEFLANEKFTRRALVVSASSGLDELDPGCANHLSSVSPGTINTQLLEWTKLPASAQRQAFDVAGNCQLFKDMLGNYEEAPDYYRKIVCLNAGAGFFIFDTVKSIEEGMLLADELLRSGQVMQKFQHVRNIYENYAR